MWDRGHLDMSLIQMCGIEEVRSVQRLAESGLSLSEIARQTGVPRGTVRHWLAGRLPRLAEPGACERCGADHALRRLPAATYAYVLGMYLGDGCILRHPRGVWRLEIAMDTCYPGLIDECACAVRELLPGSRVGLRDRAPEGCVLVYSYSKAWPCLFPQHGPGPKHARRIALEPWQQRIVDAEPEQFVRGLIHSDGCRVLNRVNGKAYPRYHFTQVSDDIRRLFCRTLQRLDIDYTWNDARNVSIARRPSVARLDEFVGPKH
jgi:hypothetical protein